MRKALIILFLLLNISLSATTYYINPSGSDVTGNGSSGNPWKSLSKACATVRSAGDIIHVNAGTYIETTPCRLAVNVSIEGEGANSLIISHYQSTGGYAALIQLTGGTNTSQHISNIKLSGDNLTGYQAISIFDRDNVSIHDCILVDFYINGIYFGGGTQTGNLVYNNTINNCAGYTTDENACLSINNNSGMRIYNNIITQNSRSDGKNGTCIESWEGLKDCKIYDNHITGSVRSTNIWSFAFEFWLTEGGIEIYDNNISGQIDFGKDVYKGSYAYGLDFHHNTVGWDNLQNQHTDGIQFEQTIESVIIRNNLFRNLETPIYFCQYNYSDDYVKDIYIYNNLMINVGRTGPNYGSAIYFESGPVPPVYEDNLNIWNNTIVANSSYPTDYGIWIPSSKQVTKVSIRNNIIVGFTQAPIYAELSASSGSISALSIQNNLFYNNGNNNSPKYVGITPTNVTYQNNKVGNPGFVSASDFHLNAGSPAIGAGIYISTISADFEGKPVANPPNIGCYSTVTGIPVPAYLSSAIENSTPSLVEMNFNLALANIVPALSAFSVQVNSASRSINSVSVSGTKVLLTLSSPVASGNTVTVSYTAPASNPLQTPAGGKAESFSSKPVTNKVNPPPASPAYVSSAIENSTPSVIEMTYSLALANIVPAASAFSVQVNSAARTVNSVSISGTKVLLTLASPVASGNTVTVAYTAPASNPLQTSSGGKAASLSAQAVTNRVNPPPAIPAYVSSSVENATPSVIEMVYNLSLANIVPAASAFSVQVNSAARAVSSVSISGTKVLLTLASTVASGNTVTVAYTAPASNPLQTSSGGKAVSIGAQAVSNRVNPVSPPVAANVPPVVVVNYVPSNKAGFVSELNASGSYDSNKDNLTFSWKVPDNIPVSGTTSSILQFLAPVSEVDLNYEFTLTVSDGKTAQSKIVPVEITPYQPTMEAAVVKSIEASGFQSPYLPSNVLDGNIGTMWSSNGTDQWIVLELKESFNIQHIKIAFQPGQKKEFYFDILGSVDNKNWEPILTKSKSCSFSGNLQVFEFPASKTSKEYNYVKLAALGNSLDAWNYIAEFRIFGNRRRNSPEYEKQIVKVYPNPARELVNIRIDEPTFIPDFIKIASLTGKILFQYKIGPDMRQFQIPIDFMKGVYIIEMGIGDLIMFTQKLIVNN